MLEEALGARELAVVAARDLFGEEHSIFADRISQLGWTQELIGNLDEALKSRAKALEILRATLGESHTEVGLAWYFLGQVHQRHALDEATSQAADSGMVLSKDGRAHLKATLECWKNALRIDQENYGKVHKEVAIDHLKIAATQLNLGMMEEAWRSALVSQAIRDQLPDEDASVAEEWIAVNIGVFAEFAHGALEEVEKALGWLPKDEGVMLCGPDFARDSGMTPLGCAAQWNPNQDAILLILAQGGDVNKAAAPGGQTPLHLASAYNPNAAIVESLLMAGANIEAVNDEGMTPLMSAAKYAPGSTKFGLLLNADAKVNPVE